MVTNCLHNFSLTCTVYTFCIQNVFVWVRYFKLILFELVLTQCSQTFKQPVPILGKMINQCKIPKQKDFRIVQ